MIVRMESSVIMGEPAKLFARKKRKKELGGIIRRCRK